MFDFENYAQRYNLSEDFDLFLLYYKFKVLAENRPNFGDTLELGCGEGYMTEMIVPNCLSLDIVDATKDFLDITRKKIEKLYPDKAKNIGYYHSLYENFSPKKNYDTIIFVGSIAVLDDVPQFLKRLGRALKPEGVIYITTCNALSLHRRLGKIMGSVKNEYELSERDIKLFNNKRVYVLSSLRKDIEKAGLKDVKSGAIYLKPFPHSEMQKLKKEYLDAFYEVSKQIDPNLLAEIYIFAGK
jgi:SAM-dependent methyltransferase